MLLEKSPKDIVSVLCANLFSDVRNPTAVGNVHLVFAVNVRISAHRDRRFRDRDRTFRPMMTAHFGAT